MGRAAVGAPIESGRAQRRVRRRRRIRRRRSAAERGGGGTAARCAERGARASCVGRVSCAVKAHRGVGEVVHEVAEEVERKSAVEQSTPNTEGGG